MRFMLLALLALAAAAPLEAQRVVPVLTTTEGRFPYRVILDGISTLSQHAELKEALERATSYKAEHPSTVVQIVTAQTIDVSTRLVGGSTAAPETVYVSVPDSIPYPVVDTAWVGPDSLRILPPTDSLAVGDTATYRLEWLHPLTGEWRRDGEIEITWMDSPALDSVIVHSASEVELIDIAGNRRTHAGLTVVVPPGAPPPALPANAIEWRLVPWSNANGSGFDLEILTAAGGDVMVEIVEGGGFPDRPASFSVQLDAPGAWREVGWWQLRPGRNLLRLTAPGAEPVDVLRVVQ